ncbi:MAG: hypothetical protein GY696_30300 [Gammaproteobacteria bacterium]|nr:hypothetical protein [Gammaproteobacteria bacterium]
MYTVRLWTVRHAGLFEKIYKGFEPLVIRLHPFWSTVGYERAERPVRKVEQLCKGLLFDCKMCGECILGSTGMSCPMNCPKDLRNGPCGGVRLNGNCEVNPQQRCVWVDAWHGSRKMEGGDSVLNLQGPVNYSQRGSSSWLRVVRRLVESKQRANEN